MRANVNIKRRDFVKACAAVSVLLLPRIASAAKHANENVNAAPVSGVDPQIERSIRANFGGGFSVRTHRHVGALTYADIEHFGNRYVVASADLLDWQIVVSDRSL
jgi:hypothetical protein